MPTARSICILIGLTVLGCLLMNGGPRGVETAFPCLPRCLILSVSGAHYPELGRALSVAGYAVREVDVAGYRAAGRQGQVLLAAPGAEARRLTGMEAAGVLHDVGEGMALLCDGASPLTEVLDIELVKSLEPLAGYTWRRYATGTIQLPKPLIYPRYPRSAALHVLAADARGQGLVVSRKHGNGTVLLSALPLEPVRGAVYEYLPFLAQALADECGVRPALAADNLCVYLDWDYHKKEDPAALAAMLKGWGIREVRVSAWYDGAAFRTFTRRFITAAHRQGIAVYAWLELPMVSAGFWQAHPAWREVTASGRSAVIDWRSHMALEDPACLRAVQQRVDRLLLDFDWDGVNLAELYFESAVSGFTDPAQFTPMHASFRQAFAKRHGVDPREIFNPRSAHYWKKNARMHRALIADRAALATALTETFLAQFARLQARKPYLQTTLTFIDVLLDHTMKEKIGVDPDRLLALQQRYHFAVEIEDPYTLWALGPDRYRVIGEHYRKRLRPGAPFQVDINIINRGNTNRPLAKQRGMEFFTLLATAAGQADRVTLYGTNSLEGEDMRLAPGVLAAGQVGCDAGGRVVSLTRQLAWLTDTRGRTAFVDGKPWPCLADDRVILPAGRHEVYTQAIPSTATLRIEDINAPLLAACRDKGQVTFTYHSPGRCYMRVNTAPGRITCDGVPLPRVSPAKDGHAYLTLPQGKHQVVME